MIAIESITTTDKDIARFWRRFDTPEVGCWTSIKAKYQGYTYVKINGIAISGHRFAWFITYGIIPEGMEVCHTCDTPRCVRPDHLFLGTHYENCLDRERKNRGNHGKREQHPGAKLTWPQVREIRACHPVQSYSQLALAYGMSRAAIAHIVQGRVWKEE